MATFTKGEVETLMRLGATSAELDPHCEAISSFSDTDAVRELATRAMKAFEAGEPVEIAGLVEDQGFTHPCDKDCGCPDPDEASDPDCPACLDGDRELHTHETSR